jgi:hypothetical protein
LDSATTWQDPVPLAVPDRLVLDTNTTKANMSRPSAAVKPMNDFFLMEISYGQLKTGPARRPPRHRVVFQSVMGRNGSENS